MTDATHPDPHATPAADDPRTIEVHKHRHIRATPDEVYEALTDPARLRRWFAVATDVQVKVGGRFRALVAPGHVAAGRFEELVPGKRVATTWGWEDSPDVPPGSSLVVIELADADGGTDLHLHHWLLPDTELGRRHDRGWEHSLDRLTTLLDEGDAGIDPRVTAGEDLDHPRAMAMAWALTQRVLVDVSADDLVRTTPCRDYSVSELAEHLLRGLTFLGACIGAEVGKGPDDRDADVSAGDMDAEGRIAALVEPLLLAWQERGVEGDVPFGDGTRAATYPADITVMEVFVHGWDLAAALDRPFTPPPSLVEFVDDLVHRIVTPEARASGRFDPAVEVGDNASRLDRLVAWTGRDPA